jgi:TPR repeat protein
MTRNLIPDGDVFAHGIKGNIPQVLYYFLAWILLLAGSQVCFASSDSDDCASEYMSAFRRVELENDHEALQQIQKHASQGNAEAQSCLGQLYLLGWGIQADAAKAWDLFQLAAQGGSARAMTRIGAMYEQGLHVRKDYKKAFQWHLRSATLGYANAQSDVGIFYEDGLAGEKNIKKALYWYRKSASQGEPFALESLIRLDAVGTNKNLN